MMGEFLSNIKFLKFYAWEEPMSELIKDVRYKEKVNEIDFILFFYLKISSSSLLGMGNIT